MSGTTNVGGGAPPGDVSFNYVPLIDVTFNLIIFFVLTSEISNANLARVIVAGPTESVAAKRETITNNFVVVNVISEAADKPNMPADIARRARQYEVDSEKVVLGDVQKLSDAILKARAKYEKLNTIKAATTGDFSVEIRADHRLNYEDVQPIMEAITMAKIGKMTITAKSETPKVK